MSDTMQQPFTSALNDPFDPANADNLHQPGFLGVSPDVWKSLANFGGNMAAAANARTAGGFLANGPGFAGPFGAAITQSQQQGLQRGQTLSDIGYRNAAAQGQHIQNLTAMMNLPLAQAQAQLQYRMLTDPQFRQQMVSSFGMNGTPLSAGTTAAPNGGAQGGAAVASGDTPQGGSPFYQGISHMESGGNANARNPLSDAAGPAQFMPDTWAAFAKENPQYFTGKTPDEVLAMRKDPQLSATATDWYAAKNAATLKSAGLDVTPQNLGIAHAFGGQGAAGILKFPDEASLSQVLSVTQPGAVQDILRENPQYGRMTVGDLKQKYAKIGAPSWMAAQGQQQQPYPVAQAGNGPLPVPSGSGQGAAPQMAQAGAGAQQAPGGAPPLQAPGAPAPMSAAAAGATPQSVQPVPQPQQSGSGTQTQTLPASPYQEWMARADQADAQANALEQQRSMVEAENVRRANMAKMFPMMAPYAVPMAMPPGDPAAMRQMAQTYRQNALQYQNQQAEPRSIRGPGSATITPNGVFQSPLEYEIIGPDQRKYRITQNAVETGQPYVRPPDVPAWAPPGTLSIATADLSPGEKKGAEDAASDAFGEKSRSQYASAVGTRRAMEDLDQQFDQLNAGGPSWYNTGEGADWKLAFGKAVNAMSRSSGGGDIFDPDKLAAGEDITKQSKLAGMQALSSMFGGSREAASIVKSTQAAVPNIENTPIGGKLVLHGIDEAARWQMDQHAFMSNWYSQHHGNMIGADVAFNQARPSQMYTRRAISIIRPYEVSSLADAQKRFLPGTHITLKGGDPNNVKVVPGEQDVTLQNQEGLNGNP